MGDLNALLAILGTLTSADDLALRRQEIEEMIAALSLQELVAAYLSLSPDGRRKYQFVVSEISGSELAAQLLVEANAIHLRHMIEREGENFLGRMTES